MRRRVRVVLALASALVVACAFLMYGREVRAEADRERSEVLARYGGEVTELVVPNHTLEAGSVISASDVDVCEWLADLAPVGALTSLDDVLGKTVTVACASGSPLTSLNFRDASESADIPDGYVAITLPITDKLGVPANIEIGTRVVGYRVNDSSSEVIALNMIILSSTSGSSSISSVSTSVSVAVLPDEVADVLIASTSGELRIVIPADDVVSIPDRQSESAPVEVEPLDELSDETE